MIAISKKCKLQNKKNMKNIKMLNCVMFCCELMNTTIKKHYIYKTLKTKKVQNINFGDK